ncbi:MAG: RagB/SusD family nutrient uptake outer membrane protein [Casimicrobiaceae bacterium]
MIQVKHNLTGLLIVAILFLSGCSKDLNVAPPNNITDQQIKDLLASGDTAKIKLIIGSMANNMPLLFNFSGITGQGTANTSYYTNQGLAVMRSLEGNDMVLGNQAGLNSLAGSIEYDLGNIQSSDVGLNVPYWYFAWGLITRANQMLNYLPNNIVANNTFLENAKASGLVVRAYAYNFLMENYQDAYLQGGNGKLGMPIYTTFSPNQPYQARSSSVDTYNFIKNDIDSAILLLQSAGVGYTANLSDIDLGVANFVLARVSLATGDWPTAISASNGILSQNPDLMSQTEYGGKNTGTPGNPIFDPTTNGFLNNAVDPEAILGFPVGVANTAFVDLMDPFSGSYGGLNLGYKRIDDRLYNKIANDDYRIDGFQGGSPFGDYTYPQTGTVNTLPSYINFKFASTQGFDAVGIHSDQTTCVYMRTSEVLLMKAEAQAQSGDGSGAEATLNILLAARTRTGVAPLTCATYPSMATMTPLQMVQLQTRIEMWGENGLEFYNNKRWNVPVNRTGSTDHVNLNSLPVSGMTMQIPQDEMASNPKAVQN